ncbi:MAG: aminotransferase class I/II-fold pyridoxal phosphate-dependent enzyme, partial [Phycisphaerae bacterium]
MSTGAASAGLTVSKRVAELKPSVTVAFMNRAKNMKAQGLDVLSFAAGEPDFDTPQVVKDAAIAALNKGMTKYMPTLGDPETRKAIADKLVKENNIPTTADHIANSAGGNGTAGRKIT